MQFNFDGFEFFWQVLMEATPAFLDYSEVMATFKQIEGVVLVHNLRIWALSVNKIALAAHLAVGEFWCMIALSIKLFLKS